MSPDDKPLVKLIGITTPPMSSDARQVCGYLLRLVQQGETLTMPQSRPMPSIGSNCHELRITDKDNKWRIVYCVLSDHILVIHVFKKKTQKTPKETIDFCKSKLASYLNSLES